MMRYTTIEILLKKGANVNSKLRDTGNTVAHELFRFYQANREVANNILLLFAKYRANF